MKSTSIAPTTPAEPEVYLVRRGRGVLYWIGVFILVGVVLAYLRGWRPW